MRTVSNTSSAVDAFIGIYYRAVIFNSYRLGGAVSYTRGTAGAFFCIKQNGMLIQIHTHTSEWQLMRIVMRVPTPMVEEISI